MSTAHAMRCPRCRTLGFADNRTPLWLLGFGRVNLDFSCLSCGLRRRYFLLGMDRFERLIVSDEEASKELGFPLIPPFPEGLPDSSEATVRARPDGYVVCPNCKMAFSLNDKNRWIGSRHTTCGQLIRVETD